MRAPDTEFSKSPNQSKRSLTKVQLSPTESDRDVVGGIGDSKIWQPREGQGGEMRTELGWLWSRSKLKWTIDVIQRSKQKS
jgi:hypothetical protein